MRDKRPWTDRLMKRIGDYEIDKYEPRPKGPDTCPACQTPPYPAATCETCGWTRPTRPPVRLFDYTQLPGATRRGLVTTVIVIALVLWALFGFR